MSNGIPVKTGGSNGVCQVNPDFIPDELKGINQWVVWNWGLRPDGDGKLTKLPIDPKNRQSAKTNDPDTWGSFEQALQCHKNMAVGGGVGFVFTSNDDYCGIDVDKCRDKETGEMSETAKGILASFPTYAEVSPSGTGVKLLFRGKMPEGRNRKNGIEMYDRGRFFTVTGDVVDDHPLDVVDCQQPLNALHKQLFGDGKKDIPSFLQPKGTTTLGDHELLARIRKSKQGSKFDALWRGECGVNESRSEADLALVNLLMFWCGGDTSRVDSLFRQSGLYRDKWERKDYREATFDTALSNRDGFYDPEHNKDSKKGFESFELPANVPDINIGDIATLYDLEAAGAGTKYFWDKWIQSDVVNLFASPGGLGKSRCLLDIIRRIKFGLPWPDGQPMHIDGKEFRSLWVLADNHHNQMVSVGRKWDIMDKVWVSAYKSNPFDGTMLETNDDLLSLFAIANTLKPHLVVVDTVGGSTAKNLAKQEDAMVYYNPLMKMARELQCPFICICHVSANGQVYGIRSRERARSVIQMAQPNAPEDEKRRLWVEKSTDAKPPALGMYMTEDGAEYDDDPPELPEGYGNSFAASQGKQGSSKPKPRVSRQHDCNMWLWDWLSRGETPVDMVDKVGQRKGYKKDEIDKALATVNPNIKEDGEAKYFYLPPNTPAPQKDK